MQVNADIDNPSINLRPRATFSVIQEWHIVLGDNNARENRTTKATKILRSVKREYKQEYKNTNRSNWIPLALEEVTRRLMNEEAFLHLPDNDAIEIGLVLVKATGRRTGTARVYGYEGDLQATFGVGTPNALERFFRSGDTPTFSDALHKIQQEFDRVETEILHNTTITTTNNDRTVQPTAMDRLESFRGTLNFFQEKLREAKNGNELSNHLLKTLKPLKSLKRQWNMVKTGCQREYGLQCRIVNDTLAKRRKLGSSSLVHVHDTDSNDSDSVVSEVGDYLAAFF